MDQGESVSASKEQESNDVSDRRDRQGVGLAIAQRQIFSLKFECL